MPPSYLCKPDRFLSLLSLLINHVDNGNIICKDINLTTKWFCTISVLATLSATLAIILNCISLVDFKATLSGLQKIQMIARRSSFFCISLLPSNGNLDFCSQDMAKGNSRAPKQRLSRQKVGTRWGQRQKTQEIPDLLLPTTNHLDFCRLDLVALFFYQQFYCPLLCSCLFLPSC